MVVFQKLVAALACVSTLTSAHPLKRQTGDFSIQQIPRPRLVSYPPAEEYARALRKFGHSDGSQLKSAFVNSYAGENGTVPAVPEELDVEYLTPVTVGEQTLHLNVDTGSADLWVFSSALSPETRSGHDFYTPGPTAKKLNGSTWSIRYGDGSFASGEVYIDQVVVGGVTATAQAVEAARVLSPEFVQDVNNDGLMGLSFSSINTVKPNRQLTFFDTIKSDLSSPLFAASLKHNTPGTYDFGFIDASKHKGEITYTPVDSREGFWNFTAQGYVAGSGTVLTPIVGIADTGTTLLLLPPKVVVDYYARVPGAKFNATVGGYVFSCETVLPTFTVLIGNYEAVVPGEHINFAPVESGSPTCFGGIQVSRGLRFSIFGAVFLKSQYAVFDSQGPRLGFAPQA